MSKNANEPNNTGAPNDKTAEVTRSCVEHAEAFASMDYTEGTKFLNNLLADFKTKSIELAYLAKTGHPTIAGLTDLAKADLWYGVEKMFYSILSGPYKTYKSRWEDMMSAIKVAFFQALPSYDPFKYPVIPGTFFYPYAKHAAYIEANTESGLTEQKNQLLMEMKKQAEMLRQRNLPVTEESMHASFPTIRMDDIRFLFKFLGDDAIVCSIESFGEDYSGLTVTTGSTPEQDYIDKESMAELMDFLKTFLSDREIVIAMFYFDDAGKNVDRAVELLNAESIDVTKAEVERTTKTFYSRFKLAVDQLPKDDPRKARFSRYFDNSRSRQYSLGQNRAFFEGRVRTIDKERDIYDCYDQMEQDVVEEMPRKKATEIEFEQISLFGARQFSNYEPDDNLNPDDTDPIDPDPGDSN